MLHDHSLIYKDYSSLNALLSEPSGCVQILYDALLRDILAISKDENTTLGIFNEALWICTRVLTDTNPELHFKQYFPNEYEPKTYKFVEQRIIKAIVYGVLSLRQSNDFCLQQFLNLFDAGSKEAAPSMKHVYKKLGDWYFLCKRVMNLRPYTEKLIAIEDFLTEKWFLCGEDTYTWLDIVPDKLGDFDPFYTQQLLGLVPKDKQKTIISKLWDLIEKHEEDLKEEKVISFSIHEKYPDFCRQLHSWHYSYTSVHGLGLNILPCKQYEEAESSTFEFPIDNTPPQVPYDMDKAMDYYDDKEKDFNDNKLPIIKARIDRWWKRIPEDKREDATKNKVGDYYDALMKSDFCKYSEAEPDRSYLMDMASCADDGYQAQQWVDQEVFACAMADFYQNDVDVLDIDRLERYIWVNQNRLTDEQIYAFFAYDAMKTYLPDLMRKSSAEELVNTFAESLKQDDQLKGQWVGNKQILEQEIDGNTGLYVLEVFDNDNDKPDKSKENMFPKDEFRFNIYECPFYEDLKGWMSAFCSLSEWDVVEQRRPGQFPSLLDCYLMDASELYCDLKVRKLRHINFLNEGIRISDIGVYQYEPLTGVVFLGVLYAMIKTDRRRWPNDLLLAEEILRQMRQFNVDATTQLLSVIGGKIDESQKVEKKVAPAHVVKNDEEVEELITELPEIFDSKLRHNTKAANQLVTILRENEEIICNRSTKKSGGKTWAHTKKAFIGCNFIHSNCNDADFSRAIAKVCLTRKEENVEQTIKNFNARYAKTVDKTKDEGIVDNIIAMFKPVTDILDKTIEPEARK